MSLAVRPAHGLAMPRPPARVPAGNTQPRGSRPGPPPNGTLAAPAALAGVPLDRDELQLLAIVATGLPLASVGRRLGVSDRTVRRKLRGVCTKLDVTSMIQAVAWAARRGLI